MRGFRSKNTSLIEMTRKYIENLISEIETANKQSRLLESQLLIFYDIYKNTGDNNNFENVMFKCLEKLVWLWILRLALIVTGECSFCKHILRRRP